MQILRLIHGHQVQPKWAPFIKKVTGRDLTSFSRRGFNTSLLLTGRRSGKSKIAALCAAYEAAISGKHKQLSKGERGLVSVISPTRDQSSVILNYIKGIFETPLFEAEVIGKPRGDGLDLTNGVSIKILVGDYRTVRNFTQISVVVDECCFFGVTEESKVRSDTELIRAVKPALATVNGRLIAISSPYARKGWAYKTWKTNFGNGKGRTLVVQAPSRKLNRKTLPKSVVQEAMEEDRASALSEYYAQWRDDVALFIDRSIVEALVKPGRQQLLRNHNHKYIGFADVSGGRHDSAALCIGHKNQDVTVVDCIKQYKPPLDPYAVAGNMCKILKDYHLKHVTGDNYAAEFVVSAFRHNGVTYKKADMNKSQLYLELLPVLCSRGIELVDNDVLINQLASLERKTRSGGRDIVDHPQGGHDDLANALAGLTAIATKRRKHAGTMFRSRHRRQRLRIGA